MSRCPTNGDDRYLGCRQTNKKRYWSRSGHTERNCGKQQEIVSVGLLYLAEWPHGRVDIYFRIPIALQDGHERRGKAGMEWSKGWQPQDNIPTLCHVTF